MRNLLGALFLALSVASANAQSFFVSPAGGVPGGAANTVQYNNAGAFGGMSGTSWDDTNRSLTITGATITASNPILNLSQTWNNAGVTFSGLSLNVTDTASATFSMLINLTVGGAARFSVAKSGNVATIGDLGISSTTGRVVLRNGTTVISSPVNATLQLGAADNAAPIAQTLSVQSVVAGTANTAGVNWTFDASHSTGSAAGGSMIFRVTPAGGAGSAANAYATALTIDSTLKTTFGGVARLNGYTVAALPTGAAGDTAYVTDQLTACPALGGTFTGGGAVVCSAFYDGTAWTHQ